MLRKGLFATTTTLLWLFSPLVTLGEEFVKTLGVSDFNDVISANNRVLVEFYAPWCGHCKALQPEYEKAAKRLHDEKSETILAKVDATEHRDLATKYSISGYPTLKYFVGGDVDHPQEYNGGRTEDTIVAWVQKKELPAVAPLDNEESVDAFKNKHRVALVGYFTGDKETNPAIAALHEVADALQEGIAFALVQSNADKVKLYRKFDEPEVELTGKINAERLKEFVQRERFPLFDQISTENFREYMGRGLPLVWIALNGGDQKQREGVADVIKDLTKESKGKLSFVWVDNTKFGQHVTSLGIKSVPGLVIVEGNNQKYLYDGDLTDAKALKEWFTKYHDKKLEKFLKSQPTPKSNDEPVYVLVGKTFEEVVGKDKDVFVEFYAPWCGHCKKLAPEYDKVGEEFKGSKNLIIAKIDATENDTPEEIRGFPTLVFYPRGSTKGTKYNGGRTASDMISWLKENSADAEVKSDL